jgi:hypothetical protein
MGNVRKSLQLGSALFAALLVACSGEPGEGSSIAMGGKGGMAGAAGSTGGLQLGEKGGNGGGGSGGMSTSGAGGAAMAGSDSGGSGGSSGTSGSGSGQGGSGGGGEPCTPASPDGIPFSGSCLYAENCTDEYDTTFGADTLKQLCEGQSGTWSTGPCATAGWASKCTQEVFGGVYIQYLPPDGFCALGCEEPL